jgi:hypothetical protein
MANSFTVLKHWSDTKVIWGILNIKLSGSVPAGGEILNLGSTTAFKTSPSAPVLTSENPIVGTGISLGQYELYYIPGTSLSNGKLVMVNYSNGSILQPGQPYPAVMLNDSFNLTVTLKKYVDLG